MKKFFKFLVVFFVTFFIFSCNGYKDQFSIDEHDAPIMYKSYDKANNMYVTWLDRNWDKVLSLPQDTILVREDKEGTKYVQVGSCLQVIKVIGLKDTIVGQVCNGKNVSIKSTPIYDQSNPNKVLANQVDFYSDQDGDGIVSRPDIWSSTIIVTNGVGEVGPMGPAGPVGPIGPIGFTGAAGITPIITTEYTLDSIRVTFTTGLNITKFSMPKLYSISVQATQTFLGVIYLLYYDKDGDKKFDAGDTWLAENLIKHGDPGATGQPGLSSTSLACLTSWYNFQGAGGGYFNNTGFKLVGFKYDETDGLLYLNENCGSITFPPFQNVYRNFLASSILGGSTKSYRLTLKATYDNNTEEVVKVYSLNGNSSFQKNVFSTYSAFEVDTTAFKNVKSMKLEAEKISGKGTQENKSLLCVPENLIINEVWFLTTKN